MNELKPCPFCGHKLKLKQSPNCSIKGGNCWVECPWCFARIPNRILDTLAIEQWNMRASDWIPVSERLPEFEDNVLAQSHSGEIITSKFFGYGTEFQGHREFPEGVWEANALDLDIIAW